MSRILIWVIILLVLISCVYAATRTEVYDYRGKFIRFKENYSRLSATNITALDKFLFGDPNHFMMRNYPALNSISGASIDTVHIEEHPQGTILTCTIYAPNNNITGLRLVDCTQVGRNNSYSLRGNSQGMIRNDICSLDRFNNGTTCNMTAITDYTVMCDEFNKTAEFNSPCEFFADTAGRGGPLLWTMGDLEIWREANIMEGIRARLMANFIDTDVAVLNGSFHSQIPVNCNLGTPIGVERKIVNENFIGNLGVFDNLQIDAGNWHSNSDARCDLEECANANGISGAGSITIQTNFSTLNFNQTGVSFVYSLTKMIALDSFTVTANNNSGSGDVQLLADSTDDVLLSSQYFAFPDGFDNVSKVSLNFICDVSKIDRECFVDTIIVNGSSTADTIFNETRIASETCFDTGVREANGRCTFGSYWEPCNQTLIFSGNVTEQNIVVETETVTGDLILRGNPVNSTVELDKRYFTQTQIDNGSIVRSQNTSWIADAIQNKSILRNKTDGAYEIYADKVGIGTTTPNANLDVNGDIKAINVTVRNMTFRDNILSTKEDTICIEWNRSGTLEDLCIKSNNNYLTWSSNTGNALNEFNMGFKQGNDYQFTQGISNDAFCEWNTDGAQDFWYCAVGVGSAGQSGARVLGEIGEWYGRSMPQQVFDYPTMGIHSGLSISEQTLYWGFNGSLFKIWTPTDKGDIAIESGNGTIYLSGNITSLNDAWCNATNCYSIADFLLDTTGGSGMINHTDIDQDWGNFTNITTTYFSLNGTPITIQTIIINDTWSETWERGTVVSNTCWSLGNGRVRDQAYIMPFNGDITSWAIQTDATVGTSLNVSLRINGVRQSWMNMPTTINLVNRTYTSISISQDDKVAVCAELEVGDWSETFATVSFLKQQTFDVAIAKGEKGADGADGNPTSLDWINSTTDMNTTRQFVNIDSTSSVGFMSYSTSYDKASFYGNMDPSGASIYFDESSSLVIRSHDTESIRSHISAGSTTHLTVQADGDVVATQFFQGGYKSSTGTEGTTTDAYINSSCTMNFEDGLLVGFSNPGCGFTVP